MLAAWTTLLAIFSVLVIASDFRFRRIKNKWLLVALAVQGLFLLAMTAGMVSPNAVMPSWSQAMLGFGVGLLVFYPLWRFRAMGAADVKLIATLGFIVGLKGLWPTLLIASLAAGGHVLWLVWQGRWHVTRQQWQQGPQQKRGLPYGGYLAGAVLIWMVATILNIYG